MSKAHSTIAIKFLFLAGFALLLSTWHLIYGTVSLKLQLCYLTFGITYSLTVYIFGGVEKNKIASLNQLLIIYLIANLIALICFGAMLGLTNQIPNNWCLLWMLIWSGFVFPATVYFVYYGWLNNTKSNHCIVLGEEDKWRNYFEQLSHTSLKTYTVKGYFSYTPGNEDLLLKELNKLDDIKWIVATHYQQLQLRKFPELNGRVISLHQIVEQETKQIPVPIIQNFEEYYQISFASQPHSKLARLFDVVFSALVLIIASPLLIFGILLLLIMDRTPIFFKQKRHGYKGKLFDIFKLRTYDLGSDGKLVSTKSGNLIRKLRLNEVPQLWNIIKGEMSLVGPRPDIPETYYFCNKHIPYYSYRTNILPGITGHAQVSYRYVDEIEVDTFSERLAYDLYYVKNYSAFLYITTLLKTVESVFFLKGK